MTEVRDQKKEKIRFSDHVRSVAKSLGTFTARELADEIPVMDYDEKRNVSAYIREYIKKGVMVRINPEGPAKRAVNGKPCEEKYMYIQKPIKVTDRQRLWNVVRRLKSPFFDQDHLQMMTDINRPAIKRFCIWIVRAGYAERIRYGKYKRKGPMQINVPVDEYNSKRVSKYCKAKRNRERNRGKP